MLVEINLLSQREPRKIAFYVILSSLLAGMAIVGVVYYLQIHFMKNDIAAVDRQIMMTKRIANKQNINVEAEDLTSSVSQIKKAVTWANTYPIQTVPVMDHLTSLLPERGFIQSFSYTEAGTISLSVQFDSTREAAYFLNSVENSEWFADAKLTSLSTVEKEEQAASETADTSNQNVPTEQSVSPSEIDPINQKVFIRDGKIYTMGSNQAVVAQQKTSVKESNILPRYTGQFELKLNIETINKIIHKSDGNEEGGTGS